MKKIIALTVLSLFLLTSQVACSEKTDLVSQNTPGPTKTLLTEPTPVPTPEPTPKPTLSEEEKESINRFNELIDYCNQYNDWSASVLIKGMSDNGEITENQFNELFSINTFSEAKDFNEELWTSIEVHVKNLSEIINGQLNELSDEEFQKFCKDISIASERSTLYINLLDSQEKIDRVIAGVSYIDKWIKDMGDENFKLVEEIFESNEISSGEIILLYYYIYSKPMLSDKIESLDIDILTDYFNTACDDLLALNNS